MAFEATTAGITVRVRAFFLPEQSQPEAGHYVWAYRVQIENGGQSVVQLISRRWRITDGAGRVQQVDGPGVVGEQPVLQPGETFEYTSGTPLLTPSGFMTGSYQMLRAGTGEAFDVAIPVFSLDSPHQAGKLH